MGMRVSVASFRTGGVLVLALFSGCAHNRGSSGPQSSGSFEECAEYAYRPLEKGIKDEIHFKDMGSLSADFRDWLESSRAERHALKQGGNANAKIGWSKFSFGAGGAWSLDKLDELDATFKRDRNYHLTDDQFKELSVQTINTTLTGQYYEALEKCAGLPGAPVKLKPDPANTTEEQIAYKLVVSPVNGTPRSVHIKSVLVTGGQWVSADIASGKDVSSQKVSELIVTRAPLPDKGLPRVYVWVFTDVADVGAVIPAKDGPRPPPPSPDKAAFEKAHAAWQELMDEAKIPKTIKYAKSPIAGNNTKSITPLAPGERVTAIHARPGRFINGVFFTVRRSNGEEKDTDFLGPKEGGLDCGKLDQALSESEHIIGWRFRLEDDHTRCISFLTFDSAANEHHEYHCGCNDGRTLLPPDGYFRVPDNYELVALTGKYGDCLDDLEGTFRMVLTAEQAREPKIEDFLPIR